MDGMVSVESGLGLSLLWFDWYLTARNNGIGRREERTGSDKGKPVCDYLKKDRDDNEGKWMLAEDGGAGG
ncbi:hypothetical protein ACH5RR_033872 [Cinchona calisaya]|uniref:Uncharacterized protein n=1 Tax=Cinchona calisaya TaxID=153742 RepID=A0ABD2YAI4_9GENT